MLGLLIEKELKSILLSPKFSATFALCSCLIIFSIYIGIQDYLSYTAEYETSLSLAAQNMSEQTNWQNLTTSVYRQADPMQIFITGTHNDIGKQANISPNGVIRLSGSHYTDNTVFAVFRIMDLAFIVQIVLSLFAILFTYDAINGEKENGTLKLNFANPLPRSKYILAKLIGSWLGLAIPMLIPLLIGVILLMIYRIPMSSAHWLQLSAFLLISSLYFTFYICLGLLVSTLTRRSSTAFLFLLVLWVSSVFIIPRVGVMIAGQIIAVPSATEISDLLSRQSDDFMDEYFVAQTDINNETQRARDNIQPSENEEENRRKFQTLNQNSNQQRQDAYDDAMLKIRNYDRRLNEDWRNRQNAMAKLGFALSRISPASSFQLAVMELAGTGTSLKIETEDQMGIFSNTFFDYRSNKTAESNANPVTQNNNQAATLNLSDVPQFQTSPINIKQALQNTLFDIGLIALYILAVLSGAFFAFNRYDLR